MQTIAILEDNVDLRESIEEFLTSTGKYKFVFSDGNYKEFVKQSGSIEPEIILLDLHLTDVLSIDILSNLKQHFPNSYVIIMTGDQDNEYLLKSFEKGVCSYIYKPFKVKDLVNIIDQVNISGSFLEPESLTKLLGVINQNKTNTQPKYYKELTRREEEILNLIKKGHTYKEMATLLNVSFHTINHHLKNLYQKANVKSKAELMAKYFKS